MGLKLFRRRSTLNQPRRPLGGVPIQRPTPTSYYSSEAPRSEDSIRARQASEKRRTLLSRLRLAPTLIALGVIGLSVVYSTTLTTTPSIGFSGERSVYHSVKDYQTGIGKILSSSLFNRSKFTINTNSTQTAVMKAYPEVDAVIISLPVIGRRPSVTLHVLEPALILTTKTGAYVVGNNGKAIATTKQLQSSVLEKLLTVQDQSGIKLAVGNQALPEETVQFMLEVKAQLTAKQLSITRMTLPGGGNEIDVQIKDQTYFIKTESSGDARLQIGAFLAARDSGVVPAEYMDVRVEEKVFYK